MSRKKLIAANWKMQKSIGDAKAFADSLVSSVPNVGTCDVVLFPPFFAVPFTAKILEGSGIGVGAQDLFWEKQGAYTGEISGEMINDAAASYVIVGHSERRHVIGESNEIVAKKLKTAVEEGLTPMLCVGEKMSEREEGNAESVVEEQLKTALSGLSQTELKRVIVAYEPVWAIGTGKTATPEDAVAMHRFIRGCLGDDFGSDISGELRILYGGSVKPENAERLLGEEEIDGALVGGASLEVDSFLKIVGAVK